MNTSSNEFGDIGTAEWLERETQKNKKAFDDIRELMVENHNLRLEIDRLEAEEKELRRQQEEKNKTREPDSLNQLEQITQWITTLAESANKRKMEAESKYAEVKANSDNELIIDKFRRRVHKENELLSQMAILSAQLPLVMESDKTDKPQTWLQLLCSLGYVPHYGAKTNILDLFRSIRFAYESGDIKGFAKMVRLWSKTHKNLTAMGNNPELSRKIWLNDLHRLIQKEREG